MENTIRCSAIQLPSSSLAINDTDIKCTKTKRPKLESKQSEWRKVQGEIEGKKVDFFYSERPQGYDMDLFRPQRCSSVYVYFEYNGTWYMASNLLAIRSGKNDINLDEYIYKGGTFRIQRPYDAKENKVKIRDVAAFELLSEELISVLERIRKYNPTANICLTDGELPYPNFIQIWLPLASSS